MRTVLSLIGLFLIAAVVHAKTGDSKGFLIKTVFDYQAKEKTSKSEATLILDAKNKTWTTLLPPKNGIALLGRLAESDSKSIQMEYIVVDTNQNNAVISTPRITALLGETASIELGTSGEKVMVSLLATATTYKKTE